MAESKDGKDVSSFTPPEPPEVPEERVIPTPGSGFYSPRSESYEQLVKDGKAPPPKRGGRQLLTPPGVGVNMPDPNDVFTN